MQKLLRKEDKKSFLMESMYTYFRWLSLDIVTGAIFFLSYLGAHYHLQFSLSTYIGLSIAIWLIYTVDHLIDSRKVKNPSTGRHAFHRQHFHTLIVGAAVVLILSLINCYFIPEPVLRSGAILSSVCVGYLLIVFLFKKFWIKEVVVALAYAAGIFLAPFTLLPAIGGMDYLLFGQVVLIALINLLVFSFYDLEKDRKDGFSSLIIRLGSVKAVITIHSICLLSLGLSGAQFILYGMDIQGLFFLMNLILYGLFLTPRMAVNERFRIIGDAVFYLPALFLL